MNIQDLAHQAFAALLAQQPVTLTHPPGWQRDGMPLPIKRMKPKADGSVTQNYRPLAILEYVHEKLNRPAATGDDENLFGEDGDDLFGGPSDDDLFA